MKKILNNLITFCLMVVVFGFTLLNSGKVPIDYYWGHFQAPLPFLLLIIWAVGVIMGWIYRL